MAAHLFPAVAVISLQMPFDESMWRACLTLQEGTASLHPVLHHLQSVLIGCRAERERERDFHGNQNTHYHEILATKISVVANQSPTAFTDYHKAARIQSLQPITMETMSCTVCSNDNEMCHYFQPSAFITKQIEAIEGEKNTREVEEQASYH